MNYWSGDACIDSDLHRAAKISLVFTELQSLREAPCGRTQHEVELD
jgi:hypothetical protein